MLEVELIPSIIIIIFLLIWGIIGAIRIGLDHFLIVIFWAGGIFFGFIIIGLFFSHFLNWEYGIIMFFSEFIGTLIGVWSLKRGKKL